MPNPAEADTIGAVAVRKLVGKVAPRKNLSLMESEEWKHNDPESQVSEEFSRKVY